jgi:hypothetical protein
MVRILLLYLLLASGVVVAQPERMFAPPILSGPPTGSPNWNLQNGVKLVDITGDGNLDLITGSLATPMGDLYLFVGDGLGGFSQPPTVLQTNVNYGSYRPLHAADLNGDGLVDLFMFRDSSAAFPFEIFPLINNGGTSFTPLPSLPAYIGGAAFADMNGDGQLDVVGVRVASIAPFVLHLVIFINNGGAASWTVIGLEDSSLTGLFPGPLVTGDFDGDGLTDIAYLTSSGGVQGELRFLRGNGNLSFTNISLGLANLSGSPCPPCFPTSTWQLQARHLLAGDLDNDGIDDLVAVGDSGVSATIGPIGRVWIWPGRAGGVPGPEQWSDPPMLRTALGYAEGPYLSDIDLDGHLDLVVSQMHLPSEGTDMPDVLRLSPATAPGARIRRDQDQLSGFLNFIPVHDVNPNPLWPVPWLVSGQHVPGDVDNDGDQDIVEVYCNCPFNQSGVNVVRLPVVNTYLNRTVRRPGCGGGVPRLNLLRGTPSINNPGYSIGLSGAQPMASALLLASLGEDSITSNGCTVGIDLNPGMRLLPSPSFGFVTADSTGFAFVPVPIPPDPSLWGLTLFAQWMAVDPAGGFLLGNSSYALSDVAQITIW